MKRVIALITLISIAANLPAQIQQGGSGMDETKLYAATKQVNQFFKRFNGEEDAKGKRLYPKDKDFRSEMLRKEYFRYLFDNSSNSLSKDDKVRFVQNVLDPKNPKFLDFHSNEWFAEVNTIFKRGGVEENVLLYFKIEKQRKGYAWVLHRATYDSHQAVYKKDTTETRHFMHPMSHELDFMNLHKELKNKKAMDYTSDSFKPDYLTLFLYELNKGTIAFKTVQSVNFHFFQIDGWYFQIAEFNRDSYNNGWLISDLIQVTNEQSAQLKSLIYGEK